MFRLVNSTRKFKEALMQGLPVVLSEKGEWEVEGFWLGGLKKMMGGLKRKIALAHAFTSALDRLESIPVAFPEQKMGSVSQSIDFKEFVEIGDFIEHQLAQESAARVQSVHQQLKQRLVALKYRLERMNGGLDKTLQIAGLHAGLDKESLTNLPSPLILHLAAEWKEKQSMFYESHLSIGDIENLREVTVYPEFIALLAQSSALQDRFFEWTLRDRNAIAPFIEFPALQEKLHESLLQTRIGRLGGRGLKVARYPAPGEKGRVLKLATLLFEGKEVSILDENLSVTFQGDYTLTIKQVFEIFRNKESEVGNLEFFHEGVVNWNTHRMGNWNAKAGHYQPIDLDQPEWWSQLPHFETLTQEEGYFRYSVPLDGEHWVIAASATRASPNLDFENTHAFLEIAIPTRRGNYRVYHFGKFGIYLLPTFYEQLAGFCETVPAVIAYPDSNVFYSHRQLHRFPFIVDAAKGMLFMNAIKGDILQGREGNLIYQVESENCAKWAHETLTQVLGNKQVPNLYRMPLLETNPTGLAARIFTVVKKFPKVIQVKALNALHIVLGAWRGTWVIENGQRVWKSMVGHDFWQTSEIYLPALLVEQRVKGMLNVDAARETPAPWVQPLVEPLIADREKKLDFETYFPGHRESIGLGLTPGFIPGEPTVVAVVSNRTAADASALLFQLSTTSRKRQIPVSQGFVPYVPRALLTRQRDSELQIV